jgi:hypothetical protein
MNWSRAKPQTGYNAVFLQLLSLVGLISHLSLILIRATVNR